MWPRRKRGLGFFDDIDDEFERIREEMEKLFESAMKSGFEGKVEPGKPFVYGFSMNIGPGGKPVVQEFGNTSIKKGMMPGEEREPLVDVINGKNEVTVIAEVPGIERNQINLKVSEDKLHIKVDSNERKYSKIVNLPARVTKEGAKAQYKNGVLEIKLKKIGEKPEKSENLKVE